MSLVDDAELAAELVREAGTLAAAMLADGLETERKTSVSDVVTAADRAAERLIVERLRAARPDDAIVGEEGTDHAGTSGRTWVVDPVDGTYNFSHGLGWWCSAVALSDADGVLLGAVHHPVEDRLYVGGPDLPPTVDGEPMAPIRDVALAQTCAATYLHPPIDDERGAAFARVVGGLATLRMLGSGTLDAMAVARGHLGVTFQHSVADWDRLPGEAIIRGLGGEVLRTHAAGVEWYVAGAPTAVAEVGARLHDR